MSLVLFKVSALYNDCIKSQAGYIDKIPRFFFSTMKVIYYSGILKTMLTFLNDFHSAFIVERDSEHLAPVVTRAYRYHAQIYLCSRAYGLVKNSIYHFIRRSVTSNSNYFSVTFAYPKLSYSDCMMPGFGKLSLICYIVFLKTICYGMPVFLPSLMAGIGIYYNEPFWPGFSLIHQ